MPELPNTALNPADSKVPPLGGGGGIEILVFKTNLTNTRHIKNVRPALNLHPYIKEWNVDLHDCDKILRVVAENMPATEVESIVSTAGYLCEELK
jgi:hypothetical protein